MPYSVNDIKYPSVTAIINLLEKPALKFWSVQCMEDAILERLDMTCVPELISKKFVIDIVKNSKLAFETVSKTALTIGSQTHDLIEWYIKGNDQREHRDYRKEVKKSFDAFLQWEKENVIEWIETEKPLYYIDDNIGYAGTMDAVVRLKNGIYVIDFKTSKKIYPDMAKQIAAYKKARLFCNGQTINLINRDEEVYNITYPVIDRIDGIGILRIDKVTGMPEFRDFTKNYDKAWKSFYKLTEFFYQDKNRRLKNNPLVEKYKL